MSDLWSPLTSTTSSLQKCPKRTNVWNLGYLQLTSLSWAQACINESFIELDDLEFGEMVDNCWSVDLCLFGSMKERERERERELIKIHAIFSCVPQDNDSTSQKKMGRKCAKKQKHWPRDDHLAVVSRWSHLVTAVSNADEGSS